MILEQVIDVKPLSMKLFHRVWQIWKNKAISLIHFVDFKKADEMVVRKKIWMF